MSICKYGLLSWLRYHFDSDYRHLVDEELRHNRMVADMIQAAREHYEMAKLPEYVI